MPRKLRKVPQFLKEIPLGGGSEGDNASEWDYAESASGYHGEDYSRVQNNPDANYLGWWGRNGRGVYYFGDNNRTWKYESEWSKYDWYMKEAQYMNSAIREHNRRVDLYYIQRAKNERMRFDYWNKVLEISVSPPREPHNTLGIQRWLKNKAAEIHAASAELEREVELYNKTIDEAEEKKRQAEEKKHQTEEEKRQKEAMERRARIQAERERQAKIKQQQEELRQKREESLVNTFDKRINLLEKAVDNLGKQKLDFDQFTVSNMTELDGIRRDLQEVDAQFAQKQKETDKNVFRLSNEISKLNNKSDETDRLNETVKGNTQTLSKLKEKYESLDNKLTSVKENSNLIEHELDRLDRKVDDLRQGVRKNRKDFTGIQEENKKINKDYIDGISVFKEQQKQLGEKVAANEKDNDNKIQSLRRDLIEVKKEIGTRVKYDVHSNNAAKRRTGTIFKDHVRARQYDAARDILKSYLSTIFAQYTTV